MRYKILNTIGSKFASGGKKILEELGDVLYIEKTNHNLFLEKIRDCDIVVCGLWPNFTKSVFDSAKKLKVIAVPATGTDHIDTDTASKLGITILSLKGEDNFLNTISGTAELAFGLMVDLARYISLGFESVKKYEWKREEFEGSILLHKALGVVGLGRLGRMMARYAKAIGMNVIACDPYADEKKFQEAGAIKVSLDELVDKSDIISIHVHRTPETENMFNSKVFDRMNGQKYLINTSRGKIVNENDLLRALESGKLAGYATDVLSNEESWTTGNIPNPHPLVEYAKNHKNLLITPHIGGMTRESREATDIFIANKLADFLKK